MYLTKIEVAELVSCTFANDKTLDYCAQLKYKKLYQALEDDEKVIVDGLARDRFIGFGLLKTSSNKHDHLKNALSDDYTKGDEKYPENGQQALLLLDRYSKKPALLATSEGTAFAQKGKKGSAEKKPGDDHPKTVGFNKEKYKHLECYRCGKRGHPKSHCTVKLKVNDADDDKSVSTKRSSTSSDMAKAVGQINKEATKNLGRAMTQVTEVFENLGDDNSIEAQSHAQVGRIVMGGSGLYAIASQATSLEDCVLLDSCSSHHVFCNPRLVFNIRKGDRQLKLESNGGSLPISDIANMKGFIEDVWFSRNAITNILSLKKVRSEFPVSYDGEDFIIALRRDTLTWFLSHTTVDSMCLISMTHKAMPAMRSSKQLIICRCLPSVKLLVAIWLATSKQGWAIHQMGI
jgi:hypothetical protein